MINVKKSKKESIYQNASDWRKFKSKAIMMVITKRLTINMQLLKKSQTPKYQVLFLMVCPDMILFSLWQHDWFSDYIIFFSPSSITASFLLKPFSKTNFE